ncbi:MAG TPA: radical SAM/SPASM domain-containing protein [Chitinophagales bacterium]|nr:radical SAM/SPASM domain-containing protein [Chitinophagales bacterium]
MMLVYISFYLTKYFKIPIQWGKPFSVSFEPTTSCNLRCPECPSGLRSFSRPIGMLEPSFFRKTIDELSKHLFYLTFYFQGEPYLNKNFLEMVTYAKQKKIYTSTSTNAHYFTDEVAKKTIESGLDRLIISIDGTTQETYQQYRVGGQLSKVIEGAKLIVKWKKELQSTTPFVIFQFLVVKPNEHQIDDLKLLAKDIGVDEVILKTAQVYDYENGNELIPENEQYSRYRKNSDGTYSIKNSLENSCWKLWHSCVITWDGKVVPCCFDKDAQHQLGDLKSNTFNQIWNNDKYKNFRVKLVKGRKEIDICTNCSEGCEVN